MHTERSDKQKAASRHNGAKSHGPVTPEGKQHSAAHTSRYAVLARTVLLPGESRDRFDELYLSFLGDLLPTDSIELALVEKMVVAHWKQMRLWAIERACLAAKTLPTHVDRDQKTDTDRDADLPSHSPERHALALVDPARFAVQIRGYENNCDRVFSRSLDRILKLRAARQPDKSQPNKSQPRENQPSEPGN